MPGPHPLRFDPLAWGVVEVRVILQIPLRIRAGSWRWRPLLWGRGSGGGGLCHAGREVVGRGRTQVSAPRKLGGV